MFTDLSTQAYLQNNQTISAARRQLTQTFWRQYLYGQCRRWLCRLRRRTIHLRDLNNLWLTAKLTTRRHLGIKTIPLNEIVGSEGRQQDFDADFCPQQTHTRERWLGIAAAMHAGKTLPPVSLIKVGSHYYVRDGHHRISVARTLGQLEIEAEIMEWLSE